MRKIAAAIALGLLFVAGAYAATTTELVPWSYTTTETIPYSVTVCSKGKCTTISDAVTDVDSYSGVVTDTDTVPDSTTATTDTTPTTPTTTTSPPPSMGTPLACGSDLNSAYQAASPGTVYTLSACNYPATTLLYQASKATANQRVVFQGVAGTVVADLNLRGAQHAEFRMLKVTNDVYSIPQNNTGCGADTKDIVLSNVSATTVFLRSAQDFSMTGGVVGHRHDGTPPTVGPFNGCTLPKNVTFDGVLFTDIDSDGCAGGISACHISGFFVQGVDGLTIRNSTWTDIAVFDSYVSPIVASAQIKNVLYENNRFDAVTDGGFYSLRVNPDTVVPQIALRNNSFGQAVSLSQPATYSGCGNNSVSGMPPELTQPCP